MNITKREGMMCYHNTTRRARTFWLLFVHILDIKAYHGIRARAWRAANEIYFDTPAQWHALLATVTARQHKPETRHYRTSKHILEIDVEIDELPVDCISVLLQVTYIISHGHSCQATQPETWHYREIKAYPEIELSSSTSCQCVIFIYFDTPAQ